MPSETTIEDAYKIYRRETAGQRSRKFYSDAVYWFGGVVAMFRNMRLAMTEKVVKITPNYFDA